MKNINDIIKMLEGGLQYVGNTILGEDEVIEIIRILKNRATLEDTMKQNKFARIDELKQITKRLVNDQEPIDVLDLIKLIAKRVGELKKQISSTNHS